MVGHLKSLMTIVLAASMIGGSHAARNFRNIGRHARRVIKSYNSSVAANASVAASNSSLKNSSAALTNASALAIPKPGTLRICNAYSEGELTATVGYPKPRLKSSAPAPYKDCVELAGDLKAGDTVQIYFGQGLKTAVYLPYPPYANHAVILLIVYGHPGTGKGYDTKIQYFRNLKYPQVAAVNCAPAGTSPAKIALEHLDPKAATESLEYDMVGPVDPGLTNVLLNGKRAASGQFHADWAESYAIMVTGESEVAIYPRVKSLGSHGCNMAITSFVVALLSLAVF